MLNLFRWCIPCRGVLWRSPACAQPPQPPPPAPPAQAPAKPGADTTVSDSREGSNNQKDWHFIGHVEMDQGSDTKIYADDVRMYTGRQPRARDRQRRVRAGRQPDLRRTRRVRHRNAARHLLQRHRLLHRQASQAAAAARRRDARRRRWSVRSTVVIFFGEKIEKIGPKKYRITNGGFSTCVAADAALGSARRHGHPERRSLHDADQRGAARERRADVLHADPVLPDQARRSRHRLPDTDLRLVDAARPIACTTRSSGRSTAARTRRSCTTGYSKTGQGFGSEYRYNAGTGDGNIRAYLDDQHATTYTDDLGNSRPHRRGTQLRDPRQRQPAAARSTCGRAPA